METPSAAILPGVAASIPFAALILWPNQPGTIQLAQWVAVAGGGLALAYLGGIRYGVITGTTRIFHRYRELAVSTMPSLLALLALFLPPPAALSLLIAGYLMFALLDVLAVELRRLPDWFGRLRMLITAAAVLPMLVLLTVSLI